MMGWKSYSYKQKSKIVVVGSIAFLLLVYFLALQNTLNLYFQNDDLVEKIDQAEGAPLRIAALEKKLASWEKITASMAEDHNSLQKELFAKVGVVCNQEHVRLKSLEHVASKEEGDAMVETYEIVLEGSFHNLVKATHQLENKVEQGVFASAGMYREVDRRSKRTYLLAKIYVQSINMK